MVTQPGRGEETTILAQSETILKMLGSMQADLNSAFSRQKEKDADATPESPAAPSNILDEVVSNLQKVQEQIALTHEFIVHRVLKKIV